MNTGKIPTGMTALTPFLTVKDVDQAVTFYEKAFGFTKKFAMPGPEGKTVHAEMLHGGCTIMLGGESLQCGTKAPASSEPVACSLYLYVEDVDRFFQHATTNGAKVKQPCTDMFWGDRLCSLTDPFGHHWSFGTHVREVKPEDMQKAMREQMKQATHA